MAEGNAARVRSESQRSLRPGLALPPQQEYPRLPDVSAEQRGRRGGGSGGGGRARPQDGRLERRLRAEGAQWRTSRAPALARREVQRHQEVPSLGKQLIIYFLHPFWPNIRKLCDTDVLGTLIYDILYSGYYLGIRASRNTSSTE